MTRRLALWLLTITFCALPVAVSAQPDGPTPLRLVVDAREAPNRILHVELAIPVRPGPFSLSYPKWIPGEHGPTGPIVDLLELRLDAGGRAISWRRDPLDAYRFHVDVPAGVSTLTARFDLVSPLDPGPFSLPESFTEHTGMLTWHSTLLYPADLRPADARVKAELILPAGWSHAAALPVERVQGAEVSFVPVSVGELVESPVLIGRHLRTHSLGVHGGAPHTLALAGDTDASLDIPPHVLEGLKRLCAESIALFGARHYRSYTFLVGLSERFDGSGLEHPESSDNRLPEDALRDEGEWLANVELLPHEIVHSWNGKYRWPSEMLPGDLQSPRSLEMLWIYEGLTEYLGWVLSARSGLQSAEDARHRLARTVSSLTTTRGRRYRSLLDTAAAGYFQFFASAHWRSERRGVDFYDEGLPLWLDADVRIRRATGGRRSLDDFCRAFFGGSSGPPEVRPYTLDDVVDALERIAPLEWRAFFDARVAGTDSVPPLAGLRDGGWRMGWADSVTAYWEAIEASYAQIDLRPTLGLRLDAEGGSVRDVVPGSPAGRAGLIPGMKLVAVDGRAYTPAVLRETLRDTGPLDLLVQNLEYFRTVRIPDAPKERIPVLVRESRERDHLSEILRARAKR